MSKVIWLLSMGSGWEFSCHSLACLEEQVEAGMHYPPQLVSCSLSTEPRLRFTRPLQDVEGREHGIAVLECKVPNSRIPISWFREDQRLLPCSKYEQIEEGTVRRLIIHKLKADDDGVYLCEMRGRVRTVANVTVKGQLASGRRLRLVVSRSWADRFPSASQDPS